MRVRSLSAADHEGVVALGAEAFRLQGAYEGALRAWLHAEGVLGWMIGDEAGTIDAFALIATEPTTGGAPPRVYLLAVATRPERRREGLARALLSSALDELAATFSGAAWVDLHVDAANIAAIGLFTGLGFVPAPVAPLRYPTGALATCLRFPLGGPDQDPQRPHRATLPHPAQAERR